MRLELILKIIGVTIISGIVTVVPNLIIKNTMSSAGKFKETNKKIDELLKAEGNEK